jgi:ribosome biogenesis GTPase A
MEGLKISVAGSTKEKITSVINVADYLLFRLNNSNLIKTYPQKIHLKQPTDNIHELLDHIAAKNSFHILHQSRISKLLNETDKKGLYDTDRAARYFLELFRDGEFGAITLDDCRKDSLEKWFINLKE